MNEHLSSEEKSTISPIRKWIFSNRDAGNFVEALNKLLSFACAEWFRLCSGEIVAPEKAVSRIMLANLDSCPLAKWLESPADYCEDIADFCEGVKTRPMPDELRAEIPQLLDLRGVCCPKNAARSRLVMAGYPAGRTLEILLDDGSPIENVPGSLIADGHHVVFREKKANYWSIKVVKDMNND